MCARIVEVMARPMRLGRDRVAIEARVRTIFSDGTVAAHALLGEPAATTAMPAETERALPSPTR